jgi:uncharacterized protein YcaQ
MLPPLTVTPLAARRFMRRALGLDTPFDTVETALAQLGYVQIDPLNICGRMHDLILRSRVAGYREGDLMRHLHGGAASEGTGTPDRRAAEERTAFEHHLPDTHVLVAFPLEAWPHLRAAMRERARRTSAWSGRLTPTEKRLVPALLAEIRARGPLSSEDFRDKRRAHRTVWGASSLVKSALQKLFFHGELLIAERSKHRRRYDLPERVIPRRIGGLEEASADATRRWLVELKLRQRRLVSLKREDVPIVEDLVQPVTVEGCPPLYCLQQDTPLLQACVAEAARPVGEVANSGSAAASPALAPERGQRVQLLAPLDPLIYDRRLTSRLWQFDYTWEAYTPAAKRVRGHYALPVLAGTELVGHVEPKADRAAGRLVVASRAVRRGIRTADALDELAEWLGVKR